MKKTIISITILLTVLTAFNGCTVVLTDENNEIKEVKEVFDTQETYIEDEQSVDEVKTANDESQEPSEETVLPVSDSHNYVTEAYEGEITAPDGTVLATYDYSYPVFELNEDDNAEFLATINQMFKKNALNVKSNTEKEYETLIQEYEYVTEDDGHWFGPYDYRYGYEIHANAKGIISVTEFWYYYSGGVHGNTFRESHTFDVVGGNELELSALLYGTQERITEAFTNEFMKIKDAFFDDPSEVVPKELPNAQYYVDADGVTAYFQQYQVGPYSSGFVSATISDKKMLKYDFSTME